MNAPRSVPTRVLLRAIALCVGLVLGWVAPARALAAALVDVKVFPAEVTLQTKQSRQAIVVQAIYADGITRDVTAQARYAVDDPSRATFEAFALRPVADGATGLQVSFQGRMIKVPVTVTKAMAEPPVSFVKDVMPVLSKAGCNTGSCHGSSRGKDGFHLSLFGYDPDGDHYRLTREAIARRINLAVPEESLLLDKATGRVPHTGGERFKADSEFYRTILAWLKAGAPKDGADAARVARLEISPGQAVLEGAGEAQQLNVRAIYADGTERDVTKLTVFMTNNDTVAKVSEAGRVIAGGRGEAYVTARFEGHTVGTQVLTIPKGLAFTWPKVVEKNYVDALVDAKLKKLRLAPSEVCDDATFVRRVTIDLTGALPTPEEVRMFLADRTPNKRELVVDTLLKRRGFVDVWVMRWAELLQIRSADAQLQMSTKSTLQYYTWLQNQIAHRVPADVMVKALLTATGPSFETPAANFYKVERDTLKLSENVSEAFMGVRTQCAQCHNHPFDQWTMNDYYSFASFFSQVGRKSGEDPRETIVYNALSGGVKNPVTGKDMAPKFLGGPQPEIPKGADRRQVLADWLASPANPYFARHLANIVWAQFFGQGIVDPVDDVRVSNPASNPELLDELARRLVDYKYDIRPLIRDLCLSRTYQASSLPNPANAGDDRNFAHGRVRRIRAEVLLDALSTVTESAEKLKGQPVGTRAIEIADGRTSTFFLTTFGRASRETPCSCEVKMEPNLSQALELLNGDAVTAKINSGAVVRKMLKQGRPIAAIIEELYLRTLARFPTSDEQAKLKKFVAASKNPEPVLNDLFWSLLNAKEFVFNH
jgi:uncharacterized protein DUF1549/uncharacterized protein DUF1553